MNADKTSSDLAVVLPYWFDRPPLEALVIAGNADRLGYRELWVGEMATFEALALAGAIARETERIALTVGPLAAGVRTPVQLAMGWASLAELAARPVQLALGASTPMIVGGWHGRDWQRPVARMRELVSMVRLIAAGDRITVAGAFHRVDGFRLHLAIPDPRITVAAFGPHMLRLAAEIADRVVVNLLTAEQVARTRRLLEEAAGAGRSCPPLAAWVPVAVDPSRAARAQLAGQLAAYLPAPGYGEMFIDAGFGEIVERARSGMPRREVAKLVGDDLLAAVGALGSRDAVAARLNEYRQAGADAVAVVPATADDPGAARALAALARGMRGSGS
jgi:probable F420-dependent oxidoreductase